MIFLQSFNSALLKCLIKSDLILLLVAEYGHLWFKTVCGQGNSSPPFSLTHGDLKDIFYFIFFLYPYLKSYKLRHRTSSPFL